MARNTIVLQGDLSVSHDERRVKAATTIKPGMLIEVTTGDVVQPHASAGSYAEKLVAKEDSYQGKTVDDSYAAGDPCFFHRCQPGDKLQLILVDGAVATLGSFLTSNGDGKVKVASSTDQRLFKAAEALSPSGADAFIGAYAL